MAHALRGGAGGAGGLQRRQAGSGAGARGALPNYRADWGDAGRGGGLLEAAETLMQRAAGAPLAGELVLFRLQRNLPPRHCGIMVSGERFIHAQEGLGVVEANLGESWRKRVAAVFEFPERA